jgi:hypothetical protein
MTSLRSRLAVPAAALFLALGACVDGNLEGEGEAAAVKATAALTFAAAATQAVVAFSSPRGLVASTGNLYWTSTSADEFGPDVSTVWRAGKDNVPGSEVALYRESGDDRSFGNVVFASPGGAFFGYFVATYQTPAGLTSQIKRVPLTGGAAIVIATSPAAGARDLRTDGTRLYWIDGGGIRSAPVGGGAVTTLFNDAFVGRLSLDDSFVYFGEEFLIMRIPKAGGPPQTIVRTNGRVSALHVDGAIGSVFWGEKTGGVFSARTSLDAPRTTHQGPIANREVNSVGFDGRRVLWVDCLQPGNTGCRIMKRQTGSTQQLVGGVVGIAHLQWDARSLYFGDTNHLKRFVH